MIRHPANQNLTLYYQSTFLDLPLMVEKGPFILEYLQRLHETTFRALAQYTRVFAFRFDLRFPSGHNPHNLSYENEVIGRFIDSFRSKIRHNRQMALRKNKNAHDTEVRYVWTREVGDHFGHPHYHLVILMNRDAYCALGRFSPGRDNMFNRLQDAWASALGLPPDAAIGLVYIPENPYYHIHRDDHASLVEFFYRASYLCKAHTKTFGHRGHGFGASRI